MPQTPVRRSKVAPLTWHVEAAAKERIAAAETRIAAAEGRATTAEKRAAAAERDLKTRSDKLDKTWIHNVNEALRLSRNADRIKKEMAEKIEEMNRELGTIEERNKAAQKSADEYVQRVQAESEERAKKYAADAQVCINAWEDEITECKKRMPSSEGYLGAKQKSAPQNDKAVKGLQKQLEQCKVDAARAVAAAGKREADVRRSLDGHIRQGETYKKKLRDAELECGVLRRQLKKEEEVKQECVVCMDNAATVALAPCGHLALCSECAALPWDVCPTCRSESSGMLHVFSP